MTLVLPNSHFSLETVDISIKYMVMNNEPENDSLDAKLRALLAISLLPLQEEKAKHRKAEELLATCGIKPGEIAMIVGKNEKTVRMSLHRAGVRLKAPKKRRKR
jgi:DNA-directed RNA polymerase specialized sigma24 family protein